MSDVPPSRVPTTATTTPTPPMTSTSAAPVGRRGSIPQFLTSPQAMLPAFHEWIRVQELGPRVTRAQLDDAETIVATLRRMAEDAEGVARVARLRADLRIDRVAEHYRHHHLKSRSRDCVRLCSPHIFTTHVSE